MPFGPWPNSGGGGGGGLPIPPATADGVLFVLGAVVNSYPIPAFEVVFGNVLNNKTPVSSQYIKTGLFDGGEGNVGGEFIVRDAGDNRISLGGNTRQVLVSSYAPDINNPHIARNGDGNTGFYWPAANAVAAVANGVTRLTADTTGILLPNGTELAPSIGFASVPTYRCGMYLYSNDTLGFASQGNAMGYWQPGSFSAVGSNGYFASFYCVGGTDAAVSYGRNDDQNTGLTLPGSDVAAINTGGTRRTQWAADGSVQLAGIGGLATSAVAGFPMIPTANGVFSGAFSPPSNMAALGYNRANDELMIRTPGGVWRKIVTT